MFDEKKLEATQVYQCSGSGLQWTISHLWYVVLPSLTPVDHKIGQPLFALLNHLLTKGLIRNTSKPISS